MLYSGTDPESYITEYTLVYEDIQRMETHRIRCVSVSISIIITIILIIIIVIIIVVVERGLREKPCLSSYTIVYTVIYDLRSVPD